MSNNTHFETNNNLYI